MTPTEFNPLAEPRELTAFDAKGAYLGFARQLSSRTWLVRKAGSIGPDRRVHSESAARDHLESLGGYEIEDSHAVADVPHLVAAG
jgi:hypothetical protein